MIKNIIAYIKNILLRSRYFRIWLYMLSGIATAALIIAFGLINWANDKVEMANLSFSGIDIDRTNTLQNQFAYKARVHFPRLDFLLRSKVIAYIDIVQISWDSNINGEVVNNIKSANRYIYFASSQSIDVSNLKTLGVLEYKINFIPSIKTIVKYYLILLTITFFIRIIWILFLPLYQSSTEFKEAFNIIVKYILRFFLGSIITLFIFRLFLLYLGSKTI